MNRSKKKLAANSC